ncbi:MAG: hypothetical protein IJ291_00260 [Lachnospiraceae bacterium]|nr:hypothetical protein [Lachnospiraceae bacterium]
MKLTIREMALFGMFGGLMYASKVLMEVLPNVHLIGVFVVVLTAIYRQKALYPIYIFVFITGLLNGFNTWWIPYVYIWTVLWGGVMLIPTRMHKVWQTVAYVIVCGAHGFLYGTLYAPFQALAFGLDFQGMIGWIIAGIPFDVIHGVSNLLCGVFVIPGLITVLRKAENTIQKNE